ncbi:hypothetical protein AY601_2264 [Pedobacter cryoconitis]|uniref:Uncharacterized protein n=1 Tax=Pedobacter cryoconitis TaxID=188932 RepID=A0A127VD28_9SPHI|nr:hypothetical protein AY601_2264 [Pedobacter cryoconitis]
MFELMIAFLMGLACPGYNTTPDNQDTTHQSTTMDSDQPDTGGEGGHIPSKYP